MAELHISSYGVMDTSLEEVFLKVTERSTNAEDGKGYDLWIVLD